MTNINMYHCGWNAFE